MTIISTLLPLVKESIGHLWISITKGQVMRNIGVWGTVSNGDITRYDAHFTLL